MHTYDFDILLELDNTDPQEFLNLYERRLFERYRGDVHPTVRSGSLYVSCTARATTLDEAVSTIISSLREEALRPVLVEFYPETLDEAA